MPERAGKYWTIRGWRIFAIDGTRIEAPHTADNETGLGCAGKTKSTPQVFLTTLWHVGLGLPWDFRVGPGTTSARTPGIWSTACPRALLVADAGFASYAFCRKLLLAKHAFLPRVGAISRCSRSWDIMPRRRTDGSISGQKPTDMANPWCCG